MRSIRILRSLTLVAACIFLLGCEDKKAPSGYAGSGSVATIPTASAIGTPSPPTTGADNASPPPK